MKLPVVIYFVLAGVLGVLLHTVNLHVQDWQFWAILLISNYNYYLGSLKGKKCELK